MSEDFGTPVQQLEEPKKKNNTVIIVVVVLVVLCCCCVIGSYVMYQFLGDRILEWLSDQGLTLLRTLQIS